MENDIFPIPNGTREVHLLHKGFGIVLHWVTYGTPLLERNNIMIQSQNVTLKPWSTIPLQHGNPLPLLGHGNPLHRDLQGFIGKTPTLFVKLLVFLFVSLPVCNASILMSPLSLENLWQASPVSLYHQASSPSPSP